MDFDFAPYLNALGQSSAALFAALLCLGGLALSCLSLSGTWLVAGAAALLCLTHPEGEPGWTAVVAFILLSIFAEVIEWFAGLWGVQRRGGSAAAGWAAVGGGILGMFAGMWIPIPLLGPLLGMIGGGFAAAYYVEKRRLQAHDRAMHIAMGSVIARIFILVLKVGLTLSMIVGLITDLAL